jgi:hypothetical protein
MSYVPPTTSDSSRPPAAGLPYVPASQANALIRSGLAIASELIGNSFGTVAQAVLDELAGRWDPPAEVHMVRRLLNDNGLELKSGFMQRLRERQDEAFAALLKRAEREEVAVNAENLSLVDGNSVRGNTVIEKVAARMRGRMEEPLRDLHMVMQFLLARQYLRISDNPFAPDVYMQALLAAGEDEGLKAEAWECLITEFEKPMAEEVGRIDQSLLEHFASHGLEARLIRRDMAAKQAAQRASTKTGQESGPATLSGDVAGGLAGALGAAGGGAIGAGIGAFGAGIGGYSGETAGYATPASSAALPTGAMAPGIPGLARGQQRLTRLDAPNANPGFVLNDLLQRLQVNARDLPAHAANFARSSPPEPALLASIGELQHLGLMGLSGASLSSEQQGMMTGWRSHLIENSNRTVDKLTIELVGMLFDHVMQDHQVPAEIKALLSRLQFPVLKAALMDADFFAANSHPARKLIDRIASTSVGWEPYGDENERYKAEVERIVKEILAHFDKDIVVFQRLFGDFETFIGESAPRDSDPVMRAKRALEEAEKREILVINTTIQVRRAFEKVELEPYLRDFLVGPWVQVLVTAILRDDQTQGFSKKFREVIHDVVWSVQPKANAEDRKRLTALITDMVRVLRDGLALIRMPEHEQQGFLRSLMESHAMAVKPVDQATYIKSSLVASEVKSRIDGLRITGTHPITTVAGGIHVSHGAVMRAAAEHEVALNMPDPVTDIGNLDRVEEARMDGDISAWQRGTWFSLWDGKRMVKAKLRWISPLRTLFMFSSNEEQDAIVLPPNVIKSYLKRGYIKPLESMPLTRRAVDQVVGDFEKMPRFAEEMASRYVPVPG